MSNKKLLQAAAGTAAAGGGSLYAEDVFSTYLWAGNSTAGRVIVNDIDVSGEGGLVWIKDRTGYSGTGDAHSLFTTTQGANKTLLTNETSAEDTVGTDVFQAFNSNGFTVGSHGRTNENNRDYVSWTFRKAEKFFDVVTYTGNGSATNNVSHNLGDVPGFIVVKRTDGDGNWCVAAGDSSGNYKQLTLNNTGQSFLSTAKSNIADSSIFNAGYIGTNFDGSANASGGSYVAYLFASDAGGFGDDGSENIIKCGSYTGNATKGLQVNCGFEPQLIITKRTDTSGHGWMMYDTMRGFVSLDDSQGGGKQLLANSNSAEAEDQRYGPTSTGFELKSTGASVNASGGNYIYIAIRRPMKTPTEGTEVFTPNSYTGNSTADRILTSSNNPVDLGIVKKSGSPGGDWLWSDRLRGAGSTLYSNYTQAEGTGSTNYITGFDLQNGIEVGSHNAVNASGGGYISHMFTRAPGFMDVVAYTGTGSTHTEAHNLGVAPELIIIKKRDTTRSWIIYSKSIPINQYLTMPSPTAAATFSMWNDTAPTSSVFSIGTDGSVNASAGTYISYLFATVAGVSKVGSYTGTGADLNVDCGFTAGARFVLIKRTDDTGDWFVWDSASGIVAGNDPYVKFNTSDPYVSSADFVDPLASGFTVTSSAPAALNASSGTYIFLAIS